MLNLIIQKISHIKKLYCSLSIFTPLSIFNVFYSEHHRLNDKSEADSNDCSMS